MTRCLAGRALDLAFRVTVDRPGADPLRTLLDPLLDPAVVDVQVEYRLRLADGDWQVHRDGTALRRPSALTVAVDTLLSDLNRLAIAATASPATLHAAALSRRGAGVLLVGDSGSGKSTLAATLAARGWRYLTDEAVRVDPGGRLLPYPKPLSLSPRAATISPGARVLPGDGSTRKVLVAPGAAGWRVAAAPTACTLVAVLEREGDRPAAHLEPLTRAAAIVRVASRLFPHEERRAGLEALALAFRDASCWRVRSGAPDAIADALEERAGP